MPTNYRIHVFADSNGDFKVYPPVLVVQPADNVQLVNHTDDDLVWVTPAPVFGLGGPTTVSVNKNAKSGQHNAQNNPNGAATSYVVFGVGTGKKAQGNSDPAIIIDN